MLRSGFVAVPAHKPPAAQVEVEPLFNLAVGRAVEKLQEGRFAQHQRRSGGPPVVGAAGVADHIGDEAGIPCSGDAPQETVGKHRSFMDEAEKVARAAMLTLPIWLPN